jgi:hypothetical protein
MRACVTIGVSSQQLRVLTAQVGSPAHAFYANLLPLTPNQETVIPTGIYTRARRQTRRILGVLAALMMFGTTYAARDSRVYTLQPWQR